MSIVPTAVSPSPHTTPAPTTPTRRTWRIGNRVVSPTSLWVQLVILLLAGVTRLTALSHPDSHGTPVFDEKHYVPQAFDIATSQQNWLIGGIEDNPAFGLVVHPPLAKQLIALAEMSYGYSPLGWRLSAAICGVITVWLIMRLAKALSGSTLVMGIAGLLAVLDGVLIVTSRFGMLDIFQTMFIVAATVTLVYDGRHVDRRAATHPTWSGWVGVRWWRIATGLLLGCALAVKWSGLYYMAFFGLLTVALDYYRRTHHGQKSPLLATLRYDAIPAFTSIVIIPVMVYLWSFRAWFASEVGVYRHVVDADHSAQGGFRAMVASFVDYHSRVMTFHSSLTTSGGHSHPWDSKPWAWLINSRPILYFHETSTTGCDARECTQVILLLGNPAIWWLTLPVLGFALWRVIARRDMRVLIPLIAFAAGFLPWLAAYDRQMYFFYATALIPFTIVLIALTAGAVARWSVDRQSLPQVAVSTPRALLGTVVTLMNRYPGVVIVAAYLWLVVACFAFFYPAWYAIPISPEYWRMMHWLPSWG